MMLMMDDEVVVEKAESVEKERSALAREIEFRLTPYLYQLGIPPHVTGYSLSLIHISSSLTLQLATLWLTSSTARTSRLTTT